MTFYITPTRRIYRRRNWANTFSDEPRAEADYEVFVPVNVRAEGDDYVIQALVPGVKSDALSIQVHNETLTIQGELPEAHEDKGDFLVHEVPTGRFYRVIHLPEQLDSGKAVAELNDGILTLRVPKAEEARPKTIKVSVN